jgi:Rrf2 family iron-sulfur cluster assembly transcriptional regulator
MTHELWTDLNRHVVDFLDAVSLQDLVDKQRMRQLNNQNKSTGHSEVVMRDQTNGIMSSAV